MSGGDSDERFYPRHPRGWRLGFTEDTEAELHVSIHATLAGGDLPSVCCLVCGRWFLSTPPSRVATYRQFVVWYAEDGFYPRHPRGWRHAEQLIPESVCYVSIHATLAGGDLQTRQSARVMVCFYPRHPRGWRQLYSQCGCDPRERFYPRHPRGWRPPPQRTPAVTTTFLSTPPSRVATLVPRTDPRRASLFLSTPPSRVATAPGSEFVSIFSCFYPRHPRGWRRRRTPQPTPRKRRFYPRHPRGWRPANFGRTICCIAVSIHATLAGGDDFWSKPAVVITGFYPRHPRGWRRECEEVYARHGEVSIHATLAGGDTLLHSITSAKRRFYPRHPRGWRRHIARDDDDCSQFLSTPPSRVATKRFLR